VALVSSRDVVKIGTVNTYVLIQTRPLLHDVVTCHRGENMFFAVFSAPDGRIDVLIADSVSTFLVK